MGIGWTRESKDGDSPGWSRPEVEVPHSSAGAPVCSGSNTLVALADSDQSLRALVVDRGFQSWGGWPHHGESPHHGGPTRQICLLSPVRAGGLYSPWPRERGGVR